jgi:hypothetical protein
MAMMTLTFVGILHSSLVWRSDRSEYNSVR